MNCEHCGSEHPDVDVYLVYTDQKVVRGWLCPGCVTTLGDRVKNGPPRHWDGPLATRKLT